MSEKDNCSENLPQVAAEYIESVIKKMRYRKKVRNEVRAELTGHFEDALKDCTSEQDKLQKVREMITEFGDFKLLAILIRRGKKRCRPLWRTLVARTFQVLGLLILFILVRGGYLATGRPTIKVDYSQWLNEFVSEGRDESLNAMSDVLKAAELRDKQYDDVFNILKLWPGDMNEEEIELIEKFLKVNEEAIKKLKEALERPYYWSHYKVEGDLKSEFTSKIIEGVMPALTGHKRLAQTLRRQILQKGYLGDIEGAIEDSLALISYGSRMMGKGLLIEQLVAMAVESLGHMSVYDLLDKVELSVKNLGYLQQELEKEFSGNTGLVNLEAEKAFWYDMIQRSFTDDGRGSGRPLFKGMGIPLVVNNYKEGLKLLFGIGYPDRREVLSRMKKYFEQGEELFALKPWEASNNTDVQQRWDDIGQDLSLLCITGPAHQKISVQNWYLKVDRDALITTLAILRYKKQTGEYPEQLHVLVKEGYLKEIPKDPYSSGSLVFKRTEEGFLLYSIGLDYKDDGGEPGRTKNGNFRSWWYDNGDTIFWPRQRK